jgi:threonylcarbamoyladenosine tRNA methylthiotransferase MtaB
MPAEETMRIFVSSLGCKLNQSEMETLGARLTQKGHQIVASPGEAEVCILNTCAVTHVAAQKSRQALRRLHRENPEARLWATGCYAELTPSDLCDLPGVERVIGNQEKAQIDELLAASDPAVPTESWGSVLPPRSSRSRALVAIQNGCDNACTYCIIHIARGPQISRPAGQILAEIRALVQSGYQEIVLTGVHIGAYGRDGTASDGDGDLWTLVGRILSETTVARLRLSSIEPWDLRNDVFGAWENPRLCRHLHLPLQSGCDATLRRMGRHYTTREFEALVQRARACIPDLTLTTDVIVGFPGETEAEFADSLSFVQAIGFAHAHVFPYSLREGTPAARMVDQVPPPVKAERARILRAATAESERAWRRRFVGTTREVLWESRHPGGDVSIWKGLTDNYLRVQTSSPVDLWNTLTPTRLIGLTDRNLQGEIENGG